MRMSLCTLVAGIKCSHQRLVGAILFFVPPQPSRWSRSTSIPPPGCNSHRRPSAKPRGRKARFRSRGSKMVVRPPKATAFAMNMMGQTPWQWIVGGGQKPWNPFPNDPINCLPPIHTIGRMPAQRTQPKDVDISHRKERDDTPIQSR